MPSDPDAFVQQLPGLLRNLADPTTPHTVAELWCRISAFDWDRSAPVLLGELQTGPAPVQCLVMEVLVEEAELNGDAGLLAFLAPVRQLLEHPDRLVRGAAIGVVRSLSTLDQETIEALRRRAAEDELLLAREALLALIEQDDAMVEEFARWLGESSW
ncbi:HEAT repeat domain-containing protein [Lignipirellula cremea]|uniref:HEAT repeat protein n=1 Tax=Lignipirellula cremea TaxID=2528010 RepID=A0A518DRF3_9BACT|nr:HEAT repeat domain-containing protein [Lignipirellula cremea]QDU94394.1 hypothetical protein Pla8534_21840 [Lignipirellula cremea]